jgi:DNA-3-methyladenine glycosylase I
VKDIPPETAESKAMSKELKKRGFRFVGPTVCYAFMQSAGLVNDHTTDCFRYAEVQSPATKKTQRPSGRIPARQPR